MAAILFFVVKMIGVDLPEKVSSCMILGAMVQKLISSGNFKFRSLAKNAGTFGRDLGAKFLIKGPNK